RCLSTVLFHSPHEHPALHSFPTRRSSDLGLFISRVHLAEPARFLPGQSRDLRLIRVKSGKRFFRRAFTRNVMEEGDQIPDLCHRSEEHTSELQSRGHLVCRLLLEKQNTYS